jgi:acyl-CoA thioester hydrolase
VSARFTTASRIRVRYAETDQMGFAYHPNYLIWCEVGRTDFIRELGTTYAELERSGLLLAVAEVEVRYALAARYDDVIRIDTWIERVQSRALTFGYALEREAGGPPARLAAARTRLVALGPDGAPRTLPADLARRFRALTDGDAD